MYRFFNSAKLSLGASRRTLWRLRRISQETVQILELFKANTLEIGENIPGRATWRLCRWRDKKNERRAKENSADVTTSHPGVNLNYWKWQLDWKGIPIGVKIKSRFRNWTNLKNISAFRDRPTAISYFTEGRDCLSKKKIGF